MHLAANDPPLEIKLSEFIASQPSVTLLVPASPSPGDGSPESDESAPESQQRFVNAVRLVKASDSIVQTVLSLLTKRDLVTEQSSKFLAQYFQFFNMYSSLGIQQVGKISLFI